MLKVAELDAGYGRIPVLSGVNLAVEDDVDNIMRNPLVRDIYLGKQAAA